MRKVKLMIAAVLFLLLSRSVQAADSYSVFLPLVGNEPTRTYVIDCMGDGRLVECP